ncbi:HSP20-like chaperone [Lipomyces kononenkoae]|uniref:HSP20-like chaperone n=1 Tax=Lipomyces kononenkoae TaxID=34357 RepID=A0ACC3TBV3_LIPKO
MPALYSYTPVWSVVDALADDLANRAYHKRELQKRRRQKDEPVSFAPLVDIYDLESAYVIQASLAGAAASAITVDYDAKTATVIIKGEIKRTSVAGVLGEPATKALKVGERQIGKFERQVKLPDSIKVQQDSITAKYSNGVLEIEVPKASEPQRRSIVIQVDDDDVPVDDNRAADQQSAATTTSSETTPAGTRQPTIEVEESPEDSDIGSVKSFDSEMSS